MVVVFPKKIPSSITYTLLKSSIACIYSDMATLNSVGPSKEFSLSSSQWHECPLSIVGIEPLKARHDETKLDLTIPLFSLWSIHIDLSIQLMSFTLYMTYVN